MQRKSKKLLGIVLSVISVVTLTIPSVYAGAENDIAYKFRIGPFKTNGQCGTSQNRQTADPADRWKVKLESSGEGKGTYTSFWLENYSGTNVSETVDVKQGKGYYYRPSYRSGCKTWVWLTAENNNFNSNSYEVSGCWDEETGKFTNVN